MKALMMDDFPALGRPTTAKRGCPRRAARRLLFLEAAHNHVEQVARAASAQGRDAVGVAQAQPVELGGVVLLVVVIGLVGHQDDGQLRAPQDGGHLHIQVGHAVLHVDQEEHHVGGFFDGDKHLFADFFLKISSELTTHPPVSTTENSCPFHSLFPILAVAGRSGFIVHNRLPCAGQPIKERRLSHIGTSDNRY